MSSDYKDEITVSEREEERGRERYQRVKKNLKGDGNEGGHDMDVDRHGIVMMRVGEY